MTEQWTVIDLFSGAGGMSAGFAANQRFRIIGAVDAQIGKPSSGRGSLQCNRSYRANIGVVPRDLDLSKVEPRVLWEDLLEPAGRTELDVLIACPPCTGFSRTLPNNHLVDDPRNSLVARTAHFVRELRPAILVMENARELIMGRFASHYVRLRAELSALGYSVHGKNYVLDDFGLPQHRERALVMAVKSGLPLRTLDDLWEGFRIDPKATHVRRAISWLPAVKAGEAHPDDPLHVSPRFSDPKSLRRLQLMPKDGGSWADLRNHPEAREILTPAMWRYIACGDFGSHPDIYGRLWWDRPAVTIKRECAHVGNGRYSHPEQDRLCTVREISILQGFPTDYKLIATSVANMYRHIGDAVPPLISYQLSKACEWVLCGRRPAIDSIVLPKAHLTAQDIQPDPRGLFRARQLTLETMLGNL